MSDTPVGPGSWQASDGKWYPAEQAPGAVPPPTYSAGSAGSPAPGHAASPAGVPGPLASWGERAIAFLIDTAIVVVGFIAVMIVSAILGAIVDILGLLVGLVGYLGMIGALFYFNYMQGETGASPGKKVTGLKVLGIQSGQPIGGGLGIVRYIAHFLDGLICNLGYLLPLIDEKKQTIADKVMSTVVVTGQPKQDFGPDIFKI